MRARVGAAAGRAWRGTWLLVSTHESALAVCVDQNRMQRSAVPPPLAAGRSGWGLTPALTAAVCSEKRCTGCDM